MKHSHDVRLVCDNMVLRSIREDDIPYLWKLIYNQSDPEWKKWDAPYYPLEPHTIESYRSHEHARRERLTEGEPDSRLIIEVDHEIIGTLSYYWEHKPSLWLEVGIGIYLPAYWGGGYGTRALYYWIDYLFSVLPLLRVGLTTWSKNERMMKVGNKLGMKIEGRIRKCQYYDGCYYDSIRLGVLREEWNSGKGRTKTPLSAK
ncbi:GNAT family N-acetyltransferase [Thalassobacillus sp. CUG 92003]|uniref:GNAT family N-acetyltransferase n=1 Tax=Thalassobacillus sp. CUG 92003 TaxID=2736641 RepID=UPI0015E7193D|nr:GNAT family protein [Thalassobacillus sp. CUG 92003]